MSSWIHMEMELTLIVSGAAEASVMVCVFASRMALENGLLEYVS